MKLRATAACLLTLCLLLTACRGDGSSSSSVPSSTPPSQSEPGSQPETGSQSGPPSSEGSVAPEEGEPSVTGTVKDATTSFMVLTGVDGKEYTFYTPAADTSGLKNGLMQGMEVTVFYQETGDSSDSPESLTATKLLSSESAQ